MTAHSISIVTAQNDLLLPVRRHEEAFSIICASIDCILLKAMPNVPTVPHRRELVTGTRATEQSSK